MIENLRTRRSIRKYEGKSIDQEKIKILKEAILRAPSSRGLNPWTFIFVDSPAILLKLSQAKEAGAQFLKNAALGIVVCGDEAKSDTWIEDCSIASAVAHFTAHSLGLGSCWIQIRNRPHSKEKSAEAYVRETLAIPDNLRVLSIISIGIPAEAPAPLPAGQLDYGKIRDNGYCL